MQPRPENVGAGHVAGHDVPGGNDPSPIASGRGRPYAAVSAADLGGSTGVRGHAGHDGGSSKREACVDGEGRLATSVRGSDRPLSPLIQRFWCRWRRLTPDRSDFWRQVLLFGWQDKKIDTDFDYTIPTRLPPVRQRTAFHSVYEELEAMSVIGPSERGTATTYVFPVPKDDGTQRFVADLTHHNLNEVVPHFQGSTESSLLEWLRVGTFRITGDLSKQYWQIPARKSQQRLMVFPAPEGKGFLQWRVLTMGAKGACRVGATMTSLVLGVARARMQIDSHTYMDEYCIQHDHCVMALLQQMAVMMLFRFLGARLNLVKSMAMPLEVVPFIGLQLSSHYNQVGPSLARLTKIRAAAEAMLRPGLPSKRQLASLVGQVRSLLRSHQLAGFASARLSEALAQMVRRLGPQAHSARMEASLRQWIQPELRYWAESHPQHEWRFCSVVANPVRLVVDSSMYGWAGEEILSVGTPFRASGFFTPEERSGWWHDTHECSGLAQTVLAWLKTTQRQREGQIWQPRLLVIGTDNITTKVAAVKRRSRSLQVSAVMKDLIPQVHQLGFDLTAYHIDKLTMDTQFRVDARGRRKSSIWDRGLPPAILQGAMQMLGIPRTTTLIDLFSTPNVAQSPLFVTPEPCHQALWTDALSPGSPSWNWEQNSLLPRQSLLYAFPPPKLLARLLRRLEQDRPPSLLVVTPCLSTTPHWLQLQQHLIAPPVFVLLHSDDLLPPEGRAIANPIQPIALTYLVAILSPQCSGPEAWTRDPSGWPLRADGKVASLSTMTMVGGSGRIGSWTRDWASSIFRPCPSTDS